MMPAAIETWARQGAAEDMLALARLVACLDAEARASLHQHADLAVAKQWLTLGRGLRSASSKPPDDPLACAIAVLSAYNELQPSGKEELLCTAVELIAMMRRQASTAPAGAWEDDFRWLDALARDTYPHDDDVAALLAFIRGYVLDWEEVVCPDGPHGNVTIPAEQVIDTAEGMLDGYEMVRDNQSAFNGPPDAAQYLGVEVPNIDFKEWDGDEWVLDEAKWRSAVREATVLRFACCLSH